MNTLRETFERQAGNAGTPDLDIDELVGRGEQRLRRRRLSAALGSAAAVSLAVALGVGGVMLNGSTDRGQGPTNNRTTDNNPGPDQPRAQTRPIVYSDVQFVPGRPDSLLGDPIHVGDRVVETGSGWVHMDVTDDGVVYATGGYVDDGRVWFSDGGAPEQIGSHACVESHGWPGTVVTGASGSLATWFDCTREHHAELVVYDTSSGREVVRREVPGCSDTYFGRDLGHEVRVAPCRPDAIIGDHVYIISNESYGSSGDAFQDYALELDVATGRLSKVKLVIPYGESPVAKSYLDDIRGQRRSLVIGHSWETGTPTLDGDFEVVGTRLVTRSDDGSPTSAFAAATRQPIRLQLPPGYEADRNELGGADFVLFEWLDDDTVALVRPTDDGTGGLQNDPNSRQPGDILTCQLSSGRCELAVPSHDSVRVLPGVALLL
jgi:hypothetical protein